MVHARRSGQYWLCILVCVLILLLKTEGSFVEITYVVNAVAKGAVCLDGSPPAYHLDKGFGSGINNWLVQIEGGGWCNNVTTCLSRKNTRLGSSTKMGNSLAFSGILNNKPQFNPDFYNWNRVKVRYCDGSSFSGDVEAVNPDTNLHFRGARIFVSVMVELLEKGMKNAENAILSGCSAGGLTSIIHCDSFRALMPMGTKVKCLSDAGYFINVQDVSGAKHIEEYYNDVVTTHGSAKNLPACAFKNSRPSLCFFPQHIAQLVRTPLFILNAAYDSWQVRNILIPGVADPHGLWSSCKNDIKNCSSSQLKTLQDFRLEFLGALTEFGSCTSRGMFINSCFAHCQTELQELWFMNDSPRLRNKAIAEAVGDWFYDRSPFQEIDCPYPCDICLDGSPPAYHLDKGFGSGINNWLVHIEGGGWCNNVTTCLSRKNTRLGSSTKMGNSLAFSGILNNKPQFNPDFYNWNRVKVRYCDGSSFTGDVEAVNPDTNLHFRGARIFVSVMEELLEKGMKNAENAILSGCSAGGLTSIIHCDSFRALMPMGTKVKCLSDAGYFINVQDVSGAKHIEEYYNDVVTTHGSAKNLPACAFKNSRPSLCFFPQHIAQLVRTPLFILNAAYDSWQVRNILIPVVADPHGLWSSCKNDIKNCSSSQLKTLQDFRLEFLGALTEFGSCTSRGMFINSCFAHCQTELQELWFMNDSPRLRNKAIAEAVGDWFYDRSPFQEIDCPYPCDSTCHNRVF